MKNTVGEALARISRIGEAVVGSLRGSGKAWRPFLYGLRPVSRRQMLASLPAAAMAPATAVAKTRSPKTSMMPAQAEDDPVFAAIERHRKAAQALDQLSNASDTLGEQVLTAEDDAILAWLTTPPTTMAGAIATLEHATGNLLECGQYYRGKRLAAGEQFPAMIAAALRKISS